MPINLGDQRLYVTSEAHQLRQQIKFIVLKLCESSLLFASKTEWPVRLQYKHLRIYNKAEGQVRVGTDLKQYFASFWLFSMISSMSEMY